MLGRLAKMPSAAVVATPVPRQAMVGTGAGGAVTMLMKLGLFSRPAMSKLPIPLV